ncbi:putative nuclease HARBI1 isoform X2 [Monomorium pharaonis]|uniref:putative nuclease HARBI1 isoform X2 n=1 Tax=Monomorium pharaonis TaxID=307658 RepID=UPI00063FCF1E|nr:putative nuclease HARBI1 isoform X2 [Monomorium pharaonis]
MSASSSTINQSSSIATNMTAHQENSVRIKAISFVIAQIAAQSANYWTIMNFMKASEEDDDEEELFCLVALKKGNTPTRITGYIDNVVLNYTSVQFQQHFRVPLYTFENLLQMIGCMLIGDDNRQGRPMIDPRKQLLSVIWLLSTPDSYRSIGDRFNMAKSSLSASFVRVVTALCRIAHRIIKWPKRAEIEEIKEKFQKLSHIPDVLDVIDGTYIPIKAPKIDPEVYINRKCFYGITLQAICEPSLKFIDCFAGYPNSVSDVRIFRNSDIYAQIRAEPQAYFPNKEFLLGDKAYPVLTWLIPSYIDRGNTTEIQKHFNGSLASTRQVIERSFALLKGRFRRLKYLDMNRTDLIPATILASCVLHNICIDHDLFIEEYVIEGMNNDH